MKTTCSAVCSLAIANTSTKKTVEEKKWERKINLNPLNEIHFFCRFALPQSFILCCGGICSSSESSGSSRWRRKKFNRFLSLLLSCERQASLPLSIFVLANKFPVVPSSRFRRWRRQILKIERNSKIFETTSFLASSRFRCDSIF